MVKTIDLEADTVVALDGDARESLERFASDALRIARAIAAPTPVERLVEAYERALRASARSVSQAAWVNFYVELERFTMVARRALGPGYDRAIARTLIGFEQILGDDLGRTLFGPEPSRR